MIASSKNIAHLKVIHGTLCGRYIHKLENDIPVRSGIITDAVEFDDDTVGVLILWDTDSEDENQTYPIEDYFSDDVEDLSVEGCCEYVRWSDLNTLGKWIVE